MNAIKLLADEFPAGPDFQACTAIPVGDGLWPRSAALNPEFKGQRFLKVTIV